jgi:glycerol-1-phosphate dehydrogenase [NAD(P)+]
MDEILNKSINEMPGMSFNCSCGRSHSVDINSILISTNVLQSIPSRLKNFKDKKVFLFSDSNTYKVYGSKVHEILNNNNYTIKNFVFDTSNKNLIPDEKALGRLIMEIEIDTSLIIAVGSGTLNDLARIISSRTKIPYIIIGTAPSMDGYASVISPLIIEGFKKTFPGVYAYSMLM